MVLVLAVSTTTVVGEGTRAGSDCPDGKLCVYADANGAGQRVTMGVHHHTLTHKIFNEMNDDAESAANFTRFMALLYPDFDGDGKPFCLEPGQQVGDMDGFDNLASSARVTKKKHCPI